VEALGDQAVRSRLGEFGDKIFPREQQTPEAACRYAKGRPGEMAADHQGSRDQGRVSRSNKNKVAA